MQYLTKEDAVAAVWGGLVLGAGGGGLEGGLQAVDWVFEMGRPKMATLDEYPDDALAAVTTGVGAPGAKKQRVVFPSDSLRAMDLLTERLKAGGAGMQGELVGSIIGHPGAWMVRTWLLSILDERHAVLDTATNGRGHPSVRMGSMGITDDLEHRIILTAAGGLDEVDGRIEMVIESPLALGSDLIRRAASSLGGSISSARGPFTIGFLKEHSAVGSVSTSINLGHAMLAAEGGNAEKKVQAVADALGGKVHVSGRITENTIVLDGAYDVGRIVLDAAEGRVEVGVVNEYLALDIAGERVSTFPDLIALFSAKDGFPTTASTAAAGDEVIIVTVPRDKIPVGAGAREAAAFPGIEKLLGMELAAYL
jgi:DUF917 family protein